MSMIPEPVPPAAIAPSADIASLDWRGRAKQGALIGLLLNVYLTLPLFVIAVVYPSYFTRRLGDNVTRWEALFGQAAGLTAVCAVALLLVRHLRSRWRRVLWSPVLGVVAGAPLGLWLILTRRVTQMDIAIYIGAVAVCALTLAVIWTLIERSVKASASADDQLPASTT